MRQVSRDTSGTAWDVIWGVSDPDEALQRLGVAGDIHSTGQQAEFQDPLYPDETKTLTIYTSGEQLVVMGEITNGIYAAGLKT
ncbi:MAG: hypothetical protein U1E15_01430 [Hyphomicrobiales bacterium]